LPIASESTDHRACRTVDFFAGATSGLCSIRAVADHVNRDFRRAGGNRPGIPRSDILRPDDNRAGDDQPRDHRIACRTAGDIVSDAGCAFRVTRQSVRRSTHRAGADACPASDAAANLTCN